LHYVNVVSLFGAENEPTDNRTDTNSLISVTMIKRSSFPLLMILGCGWKSVICQSNSDNAVSTIFACCTETSPPLLIECINGSLHSKYNEITNRIPYLMNEKGPKLVVSLLSRSTHDIHEYAAWSHFIQAAYANRNGYIHHISAKIYTKAEDFDHYPKLAWVLEKLDDIDDHSDYIAWLDAGTILTVLAFLLSNLRIFVQCLDLIVLDFRLRLEAVAADYPTANVIMSADVSTLANTGFILLRNSAWTKAFIREWLALRLHPGIHNDQMGFDMLYKSRPKYEMLQKVAILPPDVLNSDAPPMGRQQPHNQVI